MTIDLIFPVLPPTLDGIGDHTARLAEALSRRATVRVLTAQDESNPIPGVPVEPAFTHPPRRGVLELTSAVQADPPDWLFLQFNQFSYGRWGLNPFLPAALYRAKQRCPDMRLAVLFHEDFLPATTWKNAVMTTWQRPQFWMLGRLADHVFFSIEPWVRQYRSWFPDTPVDHLPVGSNIPHVDADREAVRETLGIDDGTFVAGVFGSLHESRLLSHIRTAADAIRDEADDALLLYVGPDGEEFQRAMNGVPVLDAGRLSARAVSRHFQAMDLYLAPFIDGVSTRRGSFLVGLQHGLPTVSTHGPLTDPMFRDHDGTTFALAPADDPYAFGRAVAALHRTPERRSAMKSGARRLFEDDFGWETIADRALRALCSHDHTPTAA